MSDHEQTELAHDGHPTAGLAGLPAPLPSEEDLRQLDEAWNDSAFHLIAMAASRLTVTVGQPWATFDLTRPLSPSREPREKRPKSTPGTVELPPTLETRP